jgi:hypothetical protein
MGEGPDLRTAADLVEEAQSWLDRKTRASTGNLIGYSPRLVERLTEALRAALAVEATEPPPDDELHAFCVTALQYEDIRRPLAELVAALNDCSDMADVEDYLVPWFARAKTALTGPAPDPQGADEPKRQHPPGFEDFEQLMPAAIGAVLLQDAK